MKNNVKYIRKERGLTQEELAEIMNVSRQTIISIERKKYVPSTILTLKLANYFDKSVEDLFQLEEID